MSSPISRQPATIRPLPRFAALAVVLLGIVAFTIWLVRGVLYDPRFVLLLPDGDAQWIKPPTITTLYMVDPDRITAVFRARFTTPSNDAPQPIEVMALRSVHVLLDGVPIYREPYERAGWKRKRHILLPAGLAPGPHTLWFVVSNDFGPPALRVRGDASNLASNSRWDCSTDGLNWGPAHSLSRNDPPWITKTFPPPIRQFYEIAPLIAVVCVSMGTLVWFATAPRTRLNAIASAITPARLRVGMEIALLSIGLHNMLLANINNGADSSDHYQYVHWFTEHWTLPDVADGKQLFQAPFYYAVISLVHEILSLFLEHDTVDFAIRIVPVLCGIGIVELTYRLLRHAFPGRNAVQAVALFTGAFVPLLIFKSQFVGNEAAVAFFVAATVLALVRLVDLQKSPAPLGFILVGTLWGLACLTKVSALVLAAPIALTLVYWNYSARPTLRAASIRLAAFALAFLLSCGWFFAANYLRYEKLVIGGWSPEVGYEWWQLPGYRSMDQYLSFGRGLVQPVYASFIGFWDAMYAGLWFDTELGGVVNRVNHPKWDYRYAESALIWAALPTITIAIGAFRALWPHSRAPMADPQLMRARFTIVLALWVAGAYAASIFGHSFILPFYSPLKASYALSTLPCLIVLFAAGIEPVTRSRLGRTLLGAWIGGWILLAYVGYWMVAP